MGEALEFVDEGTFYNCAQLKDVVISESISHFKWDAFYGCDSIENVYYMGNEDQWDQIVFEPGNSGVPKAQNITMNYNP